MSKTTAHAVQPLLYSCVCNAPPLKANQTDLELDCPVCLDLLYKPLAYGCGHTVCKPCHKRTPKAENGVERCPVCRHEQLSQPVVKMRVMRRLINAQHPREGKARKAEETKARRKKLEERCAARARVPPQQYR